MGAAAGGAIGWAGAGLTGATVGLGVGALAGLGFGAAAYALTRPIYWYPIPYPYYGYYYRPIFYAGPPMYYTAAV
jgi:hypothetical protein